MTGTLLESETEATVKARDLLEVDRLAVHIDTYRGTVKAVDGVSFRIGEKESVGIVGESGSGKSMTALSLLRFTPPGARFAEGRILFEGHDLVRLSQEQMRSVRGNRISMVFQDPMTFLNPLMKVGDQIAEGLVKQGVGRRQAREKVIEALRQVRMASPEDVADQYPHQLSGGMRQRALIAMAIIRSPALLVADEPTTALDVTVQAQIINLLREIKEEHGLSLLLITHDLGIVAHVCDRIYVMYAGRIMEEADVFSLFRDGKHPYTRGLIASVAYEDQPGGAVSFIEGSVPSPINPPAGCRFQTRCPHVMPVCREKQPPRTRISDTQAVYCWLYEEEGRDG
ncbi:ABC transporter ATP-binding protein [Chelativorans sp. Marseille-P2723]|uniref:ABC transporter ATP-binding protein n=1 Tax=Chelativorans sp. Marseille-P2723 TaxID=2709133 RepID=UPI001FEF9FC1|nr:ABC transporter ATP-binding protein [Chelativorans sp. Marseille-P2723]